MAGILGQELLGRSPEWFNVGATPQPMPLSALLAIEFFVVGHFEVKRYQGWNKHKTVSPRCNSTPPRCINAPGLAATHPGLLLKCSLTCTDALITENELQSGIGSRACWTASPSTRSARTATPCSCGRSRTAASPW